MTSPALTKDAIRAKALELGFDAVGFAPATLDPKHGERLHAYLDDGRHGTMAWMESRAEQRISPDALWPDARTVIVLGTNYGPRTDPTAIHALKDRAAISVYAQGKDYHDVVKKRLKALGRWMVEELACQIKVFVDTAPVMEKPLAQMAGIGWQGKHTNVVSREFGSWLFLGEVFTTLDLEPDRAEVDHCGTCTACLDACPTGAITPYQMDARKCISYLTIEHKGTLDPDLMAAMGNHVYGCDDCLAACPWTKFTKLHTEPNFLPRVELTAPRLADLAALDDTEFRQVFAGSPIKRTRRNPMVRNVLIAIGNSKARRLKEVAEALSEDLNESVRETARWALQRLEKP
ncbi:tRNA epoxyqueuosine(34) reductase QueG [Magnetovibrio sp.]|uniref:tRNA epoxyqueuosine(34) reductase QueG n=1 Tax=Magnetovibrio sp. TaxID=2024836 RepID=UPI002F922785